jgi:four helix bundle protein
MGFQTFEDIQAWQKAKTLSVSVYRLLSKSSDYGFRDQLQRASVSIMNNIAEGFEKQSKPEFRRFLYIAKGSAGEVRSMLVLARELKLISEDEYTKNVELCIEISKMLSGLIRTL